MTRARAIRVIPMGEVEVLNRASCLLILLAFAGGVSAEPALVRARVQNGTRHEPGTAEKVTVYQLRGGMQPIRELGAVTGQFELAELDVDLSLPYLVQLQAGGVNYNELVRFSESAHADLQFTVYDVTTEWDDVAVSLARTTLERRGSVLSAQTHYVVENRSEPPRTLYDPGGTFRFTLPPGLRELHAVTASSASGVAVPQPTELEADGSIYVARTAFKPGSTEIAVSYDVDYATEELIWREVAIYDIPTMVILVSPSDVHVDVAAEWEKLDPGPASRFLVLRRNGVRKGQILTASFRGGTTPVATRPAPVPRAAARHGSVTTIPDATAPKYGLVIVLMAAALAYGLLKAFYGDTSRQT